MEVKWWFTFYSKQKPKKTVKRTSLQFFERSASSSKLHLFQYFFYVRLLCPFCNFCVKSFLRVVICYFLNEPVSHLLEYIISKLLISYINILSPKINYLIDNSKRWIYSLPTLLNHPHDVRKADSPFIAWNIHVVLFLVLENSSTSLFLKVSS